jgi:hypothetical protein
VLLIVEISVVIGCSLRLVLRSCINLVDVNMPQVCGFVVGRDAISCRPIGLSHYSPVSDGSTSPCW